MVNTVQDEMHALTEFSRGRPVEEGSVQPVFGQRPNRPTCKEEADVRGHAGGR